MTRPRRKSNEPLSAPPEIEYLVTDMERLVNERADEYLDGYPYQVSFSDFQPSSPDGKVPSGIRRIHNTHVSGFASKTHEFAGMDVHMQFPVTPNSENPVNINLKWNDGINCRIAIVDQLPIILVERNDEILKSGLLQRPEMRSYLNSSGLPESVWGSDINKLVSEVAKSRDIRLQRRSTAFIDPYTNMEFVHEVRHLRNDDGEAEYVEELCLNIDHLTETKTTTVANFADQLLQAYDEDGRDMLSGGTEKKLLPLATFRNMLRFEKQSPGDTWSYRGAYEGKLGSGDLVDEVVQTDPRLGLPKSKIITKALNVLNHHPY